MVNESLCTPCQTVLASVPRKDEYEPHHPDGESFRHALATGCRICLQIWASLERPVDLYETSLKLHPGNTEFDAPPELQVHHKAPSTWHHQSLGLCLPNEIQTEDVGNNTGSDQAFDFLIATYRECKERHSKCSKVACEQYLPLRLLDVGGLGQDELFLVDRERVLPIPNTSYATLSHCWGGLQPLKLTSATSSLLHQGIPVDSLPNTFQDAVCVARRLGLRWLWIDSLCIMQDDLDDWSIQASAMEDIYQYAVLNIAATAAHDGRSGLFQHRDTKTLMPCQIESVWNDQGQTRTFFCTRRGFAIDYTPLNRRAWVIQERQLSRRIVHYTNNVLHWECHELFANEIYPDGLPRRWTGHRSWDAITFKALLDDFHSAKDMRAQQELLYDEWQTLMSNYTGCKLTYEKDRLVAVAGLSRRVSSLLQDELVAGIWRTRFIEGLCWFTLPPMFCGGDRDSHEFTKVWVAPSWSWASSPYPVQFYLAFRGGIPRHLVKLVDLSVSTKPSGALENGSIQLSCRLVSAKLCFNQGPDDLVSWLFLEGCEAVSHIRPSLRLDNPHLVKDVERQEDILLLPILERKHTDYVIVYGMAVIPSVTEIGAYQRIGGIANGWYPTDTSPMILNVDDWKFWVELLRRHALAEEQVIKII